jgi:hypothetical protein
MDASLMKCIGRQTGMSMCDQVFPHGQTPEAGIGMIQLGACKAQAGHKQVPFCQLGSGASRAHHIPTTYLALLATTYRHATLSHQMSLSSQQLCLHLRNVMVPHHLQSPPPASPSMSDLAIVIYHHRHHQQRHRSHRQHHEFRVLPVIHGKRKDSSGRMHLQWHCQANLL